MVYVRRFLSGAILLCSLVYSSAAGELKQDLEWRPKYEDCHVAEFHSQYRDFLYSVLDYEGLKVSHFTIEMDSLDKDFPGRIGHHLDAGMYFRFLDGTVFYFCDEPYFPHAAELACDLSRRIHDALWRADEAKRNERALKLFRTYKEEE